MQSRKRIPLSRILTLLVISVWIMLSSATVSAKVEVVQFESTSQQALYEKLIQELRCLVCQNQNLADSNADLAIDLRRRVRELINDGKDYDDIAGYMVERYGAFVMYRPPFDSSTFFLWLSPVVLLLGTFGVILLRRKNAIKIQEGDAHFDASQHDAVRALLEDRS